MNSDIKYGKNLADKVFSYLESGSEISHSHYGYCGVGLIMMDDVIHYTHIDEWLTYREGVIYQPGGKYLGIIKSFTSKNEFVTWFSLQTDSSLSGNETGDDWYIGNQRITRCRLEMALSIKNT